MIRFNGITIDRQRGRITHNGAVLKFARRGKSHHFRLASFLLLAGPQTKRQLFDLLYRDDSEGGPLDPKTIDVMLNRLKRQFRTIGINLRGEALVGNRKHHWAEAEEVVRLEAAE